MTHTTYVNASGLPDDDQLTTARDQALLGRAIQDRFPNYYKYFSTESFVYRGEAMRNHNHLLGTIEGVDGIKTGFTRASGFNLLTSVHRDGRYIVAVVLGGPSASDRDDRMRDLIGDHLKEASLHRTAPMITEAAAPHEEAQPVAFAKAAMAASASVASHADPTTTASVDAHVAAGSNDPIKPLLVKTITYRTAPVQIAALAPMPMLMPVAASAPTPAAKPVASEPPIQTAPQRADQLHALVAAADAATAAKVEAPQPPTAPPEPAKADLVAPPAPANNSPAPAQATAAQSPAPQPIAAQSPQPIAAQTAVAQPTATETPPALAPVEAEAAAPDAAPVMAYAEPAKAEPAIAEPAIASAAPVHAHGGWLIQIGAYDDEDQARQHLSAAQLKVSVALKAADPFTERIQKGDKAMYRARFAGFDRATAEAACRQLKRSDFECMALKD
jgi:D-alanyl-D-alanine carboxypeptidase